MLTNFVGYSLPGNVQAGAGSLSVARIVRRGPVKVYDRPVYREVDVSVDEYGDNALRIFVRQKMMVYHSINNGNANKCGKLCRKIRMAFMSNTKLVNI